MRTILILFVLLSLTHCIDDEDAAEIEILSVTVDGTELINSENLEISPSAKITVTFSGSIDSQLFGERLEISSQEDAANFEVSFSNASTKALVSVDLKADVEYVFSIESGALGSKGEVLKTSFIADLLTKEGAINPCLVSEDCYILQTFVIEGSNNTFGLYSSFPLFDGRKLEKVENAIILIHGANRNADEYFNWMISTLRDLELLENTILIAPAFKLEDEAAESELYWGNNNWREGANSSGGREVSSFALIDSLVQHLRNTLAFPSLERIMVTGHSSGGLFTHAYAAGNNADNGTMSTVYVPANSQYFYYPTKLRIDEAGSTFMPVNCTGYDFWPIGFNLTPSYLEGLTESEINKQFLEREMIYLLGNGNQSDPSLNTRDCYATLLGPSRYQRGENVFDITEFLFPDNNHSKRIVEGIGHDGRAVYQSEEFKELLREWTEQ